MPCDAGRSKTTSEGPLCTEEEKDGWGGRKVHVGCSLPPAADVWERGHGDVFLVFLQCFREGEAEETTRRPPCSWGLLLSHPCWHQRGKFGGEEPGLSISRLTL